MRRNLEIARCRTSFALDVGVGDALVEICRGEGVSLDGPRATIVAKSRSAGMVSAIRTYVLEYFMNLDMAGRGVA